MSAAENPIDNARNESTEPLKGVESEPMTPQTQLTDVPEPPINEAEASLREIQPSEETRLSIESEPPIEQPADSAPFLSSASDEAAIADATMEVLWQSDPDMAELVNLNQALHQQNTELLNHVEQLEQLLDECNSALQLQVKRSQSLEQRLNQQSEDFKTAQEQLTRLFRELEASHQVAQRQQILIETITQQLQSSQEQVANLERECALIQQRYNDQSYQLSQSETVTQELRSRLLRQQRYTLQFKAALDKCLEMPAVAASQANQNVIALAPASQKPPTEQRLLLKPQPIQPWSAASEELTDQLEAKDSITENSFPPIGSTEETNPELSTPEDLLKTTTEPFAAESAFNLAINWSSESVSHLSQNLRQTEEALWQELERLTSDAISEGFPSGIAPEPTESSTPENVPPANLTTNPFTPAESIEVPLINQEKSPTQPETREIVIEPLANPPQSVTANTMDQLASPPTTTSWPSPIVYPQRPQKKIKSLAAIDLPTFPRRGEQPPAPAQ